MALVEKVKVIIGKAEEIQQLNMFSRPAEYEKLVSAEIVPLLLEVAQHIDDFNSPAELPAAAISLDELNQLEERIQARDNAIAELRQEITTLKGRVTKIQKSGTGAAA